MRRLVAPVAVVLLFLLATHANYLGENAQRVRVYYQPDVENHVLLDADEARSFERLARDIPADAVVAEDPWNGTSLLFAVTGRRVLFGSEKAANTPDRQLLAHHLDEAATSPEVCAAVRRLHVTHVLLGGTSFTPSRHGSKTFEGVKGVRQATSGFEEVARTGGFRLYRVTACG